MVTTFDVPEKGDNAKGPSDFDRLICLVGVKKFISRVCAIAGLCGCEDALAVDAAIGSGHAGI